MGRFSWCVAVAVVLAWSAVAAAGTLKVPSGFGSIQDAVDAAGDGDVIEVSKGTYVETVLIAARSGITIKARDDGADIEGAANVVDGVVSKKAGDNGFEVNGSGNTFRNCKASKSGTFDLNDTDGRNSYEPGNRFGSQKIDT